MGLLSEGSPLSWEETKRHADHVRKHGIAQFINIYNKFKDSCHPCLKWGDEVEYMLIFLDHENRRALLNLKAQPILQTLQQKELDCPSDHPTTWRPEYAEYMVEGTPGKPYGGLLAHFNLVEANMKLRREEVLKLLTETGETALSLTSFPRLGCPPFTQPDTKPSPEEGASRSLFFPENVIFHGHPRFKTLTRNIRCRRGEKVAINIPIFKDCNTKNPFIENFTDPEAQRAALPDHIYMDAMGFGMGQSCLQMTFQACNINEARSLYDQLTPLAPIILALSAACPLQRGYVSDQDCRWNIIAASVDDRTEEERGLKPLQENKHRIFKSRYDSIDSYLSQEGEKYNDIDLVLDKDTYNTLRTAGIDHLLAQHVAHLFIRDPISLFSEKIDQDDETETDHFENIQSTNWQTMRFKPPPPNTDIGWRVEFRPTEVQLTDFENAAFVVFVVMMTRVILSYGLKLLIPISKVDENMKTAQKRDAAKDCKFYFRKDVSPDATPPEAEAVLACCKGSNEYTCMTVDEIINGKESEFPGLLPLIESYLNSVDDVDVDTRCTINQYLKFIQKRASGELKTTARWIRDFVSNHPDYKQDSVVTDSINYDLMVRCEQITKGEVHEPELIIPHRSKTTDDIPKAMKLASKFYAKKHNHQPCE